MNRVGKAIIGIFASGSVGGRWRIAAREITVLLKIRITALASILIISQTLVAHAQSTHEQPDGWNVVRAIPVGELLLVGLKDDRQIKGKLSSASETDLMVLEGSRSATLSRDNIRRIFRLVGKTRGRSALKGAGIGAVTGASIGLALYLPARDDIVGWIVPACGVIGTGIGAAIGGITGGGQKKVLIYEAR